jgi:mono/diheme cytochrome c family protein
MNRKIAGSFVILVTVLIAGTLFAQTSGAPAQMVKIDPKSVVKYWLEPEPAGADVLERGKWLFRKKGCFLCHGPQGEGGVPNRNYIKGTIPRLDLATQMKLFESEDVTTIIDLMKRSVRLDTLANATETPVPQYNVVLAQYHSIQDVVRKGNPAGKKNIRKPAPPLNMPSWRRELSDTDIDALIAYLLSAVPREEPR